MDALLRIEDLRVHFPSAAGTVRALDGVSLAIEPGETFGMVGETGAGKSLTAWATIGLLPPAARLDGGTIRYDGRELAGADRRLLESLRGPEIAIIVQNPKSALNPMARIGDQLANVYRAHKDCSRTEAWERGVESLQRMGIPDPGRRARGYPHQLSIGMAQRVLIAMALLHRPRLLIADEPTSGLDVTIQADVLDLLMELVDEHGTALWLITHDLGVVANYCQRAAVMFAGEVVEEASVEELFRRPEHPYVRGLLDSRPGATGERLRIAGPPPDLMGRSNRCRFDYRCPWVEHQCRHEPPPLEAIRPGHPVRCWVAQRRAASAEGENVGVTR